MYHRMLAQIYSVQCGRYASDAINW